MGGENWGLDFFTSFPSFWIRKCLGNIKFLWELYVSFTPTFQKKKILVLLGWKGMSRCCAQNSWFWEQRHRVPTSRKKGAEAHMGFLTAVLRWSLQLKQRRLFPHVDQIFAPIPFCTFTPFFFSFPFTSAVSFLFPPVPSPH